jgi:hypothetical protein
MSSISDKFNYLIETKELIKNAIIEKGGDINDNTPLENIIIKLKKFQVQVSFLESN